MIGDDLGKIRLKFGTVQGNSAHADKTLILRKTGLFKLNHEDSLYIFHVVEFYSRFISVNSVNDALRTFDNRITHVRVLDECEGRTQGRKFLNGLIAENLPDKRGDAIPQLQHFRFLL